MSNARDDKERENLARLREGMRSLPKKKVPGNIPPSTVRNDLAIGESSAIADGDYDQAERNRKDAETQSIRESNKDLRVNRKLRWKYAKWVFCYLVSYSTAVLVLLILAGFQILGFELPGEVLGFLVGSTAVSAIGLVLAVTTGLFRNNGSRA